LALLLAGFVVYLIPVVRDEAGKLPDFFTRAATDLLPWLETHVGMHLPAQVRQRFTELGGDLAQMVASAGPTLAGIAAAFAGNTARFLATVLGLLVVPVLCFFFLRDYPRIT